ncbi:MAG: hypothetical protein IPN64_00105 [Propionivibrio sp.]|uniref:hypothetical protein n=1 Tax=Propionivibrio sp. TaxID=2212460 RepID=UPI0025CDAC80|nr:hypothetical protein [Propionivibrio sp.]MBK8892501.1 hypothetical protein [Propionivibrio sp.]
MHIDNITEKRWLQACLEPIRAKGTYTSAQKLRFLERLTAAETLRTLSAYPYVGRSGFAGGGESLIVALDELVRVLPAARGVDDLLSAWRIRGV